MLWITCDDDGVSLRLWGTEPEKINGVWQCGEGGIVLKEYTCELLLGYIPVRGGKVKITVESEVMG